MSEPKTITGGAVASEHHIASKIGTDVLGAGGNAVDAIIATIIAVNTLAPYHSDLGGGGFAIIRQSDGAYEALDFRHTAPQDVTMDFYQKGASTSVGGSAVAVPGQMRGLGELHRRYGQLPWSNLLQPSIELAKEGVPAGKDLRSFVMRDTVPPGSDSISGSFYESDSQFHSLFRDGKALSQGDIYTRPEYARTLQILAERGAEAFYEGEIAEAVVEVVRARGGLMKAEDLRDYRPRWVKPLCGSFRGHDLWTVPAPASGSIWLLGMSLLGAKEVAPQGSVLEYHRVTEAMRIAYGNRTELGDPSYVDDVKEKEAQWGSKAYIAERAALLSDERTFPPDYYQTPRVEVVSDGGTSNITTADSTGMVVSITTTVGLGWGSRIMVPGYGFILNDSMDDFSVAGRPNATGYEPSEANYVEGGKRPLSSSCPYIIEKDGQVALAGGSAGGSTIISANIQVARNVLDHGMSAAEALSANRLHNQVLPNVSQLERSSSYQKEGVTGFSDATAAGLEDKGHKIQWVPSNRSVPCAIKFLPGPSWEPAGDPRKYDTGGSVYEGF